MVPFSGAVFVASVIGQIKHKVISNQGTFGDAINLFLIVTVCDFRMWKP